MIVIKSETWGEILRIHDTMSTCLLRPFMYLAFSHMEGVIFQFTMFNHLLRPKLPRFYLQHNLTYVLRILIIKHGVIV